MIFLSLDRQREVGRDGLISYYVVLLVAPEMVKIELRIACIRAKMIGHKFLHRLLSGPFASKINLS
jgi:hypothetical protein